MNIRCKTVTQIAFIITNVSLSTKFQMKIISKQERKKFWPLELKKENNTYTTHTTNLSYLSTCI